VFAAPGRLSVIDAGTNVVVRTATVGSFQSHIAVFSASAVYVTDLGSDDLATVDPASGAVTRVAVGSKPAGLAIVGGARMLR
jgi:YVTN family beta-propeller protein